MFHSPKKAETENSNKFHSDFVFEIKWECLFTDCYSKKLLEKQIWMIALLTVCHAALAVINIEGLRMDAALWQSWQQKKVTFLMKQKEIMRRL